MRYLVRAVVQALMRALVKDGALCVLLAYFQSDGVLSRLCFDLQRDFVFGGGFDGSVRNG